jgi:hypothetical protein
MKYYLNKTPENVLDFLKRLHIQFNPHRRKCQSFKFYKFCDKKNHGTRGTVLLAPETVSIGATRTVPMAPLLLNKGNNINI